MTVSCEPRRFAVVVAVLTAVSSGLAGCSAHPGQLSSSTAPRLLTTATTYDATASPDTSFVRSRFLNVPYATESSAEKLDVYLPNGGSGPYPVVVAIHGGGFRVGDKADAQITPMLSALDRGYAVVSINYRLSGEARWPAQIEDAKAAIRFLRANATTYGLDPQRIAVWGDSAGGDLAALLGTTGGVSGLAGTNPANAEQSDRVQAVVDWFGPIDYASMDAQAGGKSSNTPQAELFGAPLVTVPDQVRAANATAYITPDDPPFLIEHGTMDRTIPVGQSQDFAAALMKDLGAEKVTLKLLEGADHMSLAFTTRDNLNFVLDWLDAHVK